MLAEINFWLGETAKDFEDKIAFYDEGVLCGEACAGIDENSLEANFWLAVCYGAFGQEKIIEEIKRQAREQLESL